MVYQALHAVEGLTRSVVREVGGQGIRVNAVAPGPVETGMLNRFIKHDEATNVFVSSRKAAFVTGQSFSVDGGRLA